MNAIGSQIRHIASDCQRLFLESHNWIMRGGIIFSNSPRMVICLVGKSGVRLCDFMLDAPAMAGFASPI